MSPFVVPHGPDISRRCGELGPKSLLVSVIASAIHWTLAMAMSHESLPNAALAHSYVRTDHDGDDARRPGYSM
jgi:hypothetical protein